MDNSKRVGINTIAQYVRTVFNMVLALYTVRIVLDTLGASDYGIYTVIAGVTSMLAFITNALTSTTQRFMSFYQGKKDLNKMKEVFSNSEMMHLFVGFLFLVGLLLIQPLLFNGFLNIPSDRTDAAQGIYIIVGFILFTTFCTAPFKALLVSHENIVFISVIEVVDAILKVVMVLILPYVPFDKLLAFGFILLSLQLLNFSLFSLYTFKKYPECILPRLSLFNRDYIKNLLSYAGWTIYGMGSVICRTQGIAILINKFLNTVVNAAYGIGFQLSASISTISTAFLNAMRPQIVKSEGAGDRDRALRLSSLLCKTSFYLITVICIPCVFEMSTLLSLWIKDVPEYTVLFARMALLAGIIDTLTLGLSVINEAIGNIKSYNLVVATLKLMALPLSLLFLYLGYGPIMIVVSYLIVELISAFVRVPFVENTAGLNSVTFIKNVICRELIPCIILFALNYSIVYSITNSFRVLLTFALSIVVYSIAFYVIGLTSTERSMVKCLISNRNQNG